MYGDPHLYNDKRNYTRKTSTVPGEDEDDCVVVKVVPGPTVPEVTILKIVPPPANGCILNEMGAELKTPDSPPISVRLGTTGFLSCVVWFDF